MAVSIGVFVLVAFVYPDDGLTSSSVRHGLVLMVVLAAPAIGALLAPEHATAFGGGMFVAGAATLPGGNQIGLIMLVPGLLLMLAGAAHRPPLTPALLIRMVLSALALALGVYMALDTGLVAGLVALLLAALVTTSGRWKAQGS